MDSVWALIDGGVYDFKSPAGAWSYYRTLCRRGGMLEEIDKVYSAAINDLTKARIEFLIADRHYIRQMQVRSKGLLIRQPFEFKGLIMPPMLILPLDVAEKIVDFAQAGGYVYLLGQLPTGSPQNGLDDPEMKTLMDKLRSLPTVRDSAGGITGLVREGGPFLKSNAEFLSGKFDMIQLHRRIDLSIQPVAVAPRLIAPNELVNCEGDDKMLDSWLDWGLDRFSGYVDYRTAFDCDVNDGQIILDLGEVKHMAEIWLNGQHVGARLWPPFEFDISGLVRKGSNELHIRGGNLIANAMRQFAPTLEAESGSVWRSTPPTEQDFDAGLLGPVRVKRNLRGGCR